MDLAVPITGLYAGIQAILGFALSAGIGPTRGKLGISIGDGGNADLLLKIRRHGNWAENVPLALLLIGLLELNGAGSTLLHGLGAALLAARIAHPLGLKKDKVNEPLRIGGAVLTGLVTMVAAIALIVKAL
ncbi:MAG: MAPEG family protein [Deltaproteobacteria bacterium]|nr:MAPEG family protein [Deltaproteobacteria bacterium]